MAAAPLLPRRQRWAFLYILILSQAGLTGHSRAPQHSKGKNKGIARPIDCSNQGKENKRKTKERYNLGGVPTPLLIRTVLPLPLLRGHTLRFYAPDPGRAQKISDRLHSPPIPQKPDRGSVCAFPLARLP